VWGGRDCSVDRLAGAEGAVGGYSGPAGVSGWVCGADVVGAGVGDVEDGAMKKPLEVKKLSDAYIRALGPALRAQGASIEKSNKMAAVLKAVLAEVAKPRKK
jgi:hypothetical protein